MLLTALETPARQITTRRSRFTKPCSGVSRSGGPSRKPRPTSWISCAARVAVQPIQPETAHVALQAFARYGKGRGHPARLNLGDCFIYAQAKLGGASLLYKGDDFSKTDIESAS